MPEEMAIRGTHDWVAGEVARELAATAGGCVVDIGAGQGSLTKRLHEAGYDVSACDLVPELFDVPDIECRACAADGTLPYEEGEFDLAVAVEVLEHIDGHLKYFREAARILKPGGKLLFTTPNILSLKSRMSYLATGYFYSYPPLDPDVCDPVGQHISGFTLNRYEWALAQSGLKLARITTDKIQRSSFWLFWFVPLIRLLARSRFGEQSTPTAQNSTTALFGRKLLIVAQRQSDDSGGSTSA